MALDTLIMVRMSVEEREALDAAAQADGRSGSNLVRKLVRDFLVRRGYLPPAPEPAPPKEVKRRTRKTKGTT